jgi:hypothetical protein
MIDSSSFGNIVVDGKGYGDIKIDKDGNVMPWHYTEHHTVLVDDLLELVEGIDVLVIGIGTAGCVRVVDEVKAMAKKKKIKLVIENTADACKSYNDMLKKKPGRVAAILHSTC